MESVPGAELPLLSLLTQGTTMTATRIIVFLFLN